MLVISPIDPVDGIEGPFPVTSRERDNLLPQTEVDEVLCKGAPVPICGEQAVQKVIPMIAEKARWGELNGYDAVVINCMVDPGVRQISQELKYLLSVQGVRPEAWHRRLAIARLQSSPTASTSMSCQAGKNRLLRNCKLSHSARLKHVVWTRSCSTAPTWEGLPGLCKTG